MNRQKHYFTIQYSKEEFEQFQTFIMESPFSKLKYKISKKYDLKFNISEKKRSEIFQYLLKKAKINNTELYLLKILITLRYNENVFLREYKLNNISEQFYDYEHLFKNSIKKYSNMGYCEYNKCWYTVGDTIIIEDTMSDSEDFGYSGIVLKGRRDLKLNKEHVIEAIDTTFSTILYSISNVIDPVYSTQFRKVK